MKFIPLLEALEPRKGDVFWDLGCGSGRALVVASLVFGRVLTQVNGVEYLEGLAKIAGECVEKSLALAGEWPHVEDSKVYTGDLLKIDWWTGANIIFIANVLFG